MKMIITTNNLSETAYLLDRGHHIVKTQLKPGNYGVQEFFISLEGIDIDLDHKNFLYQGSIQMKTLPQVLQTIGEHIWQEEEASV